jgi:hypothetical protein
MKLFSLRFTPAKGWHWQHERDCAVHEAQAWLEVYRKDEPPTTFVVRARKPVSFTGCK